MYQSRQGRPTITRLSQLRERRMPEHIGFEWLEFFFIGPLAFTFARPIALACWSLAVSLLKCPSREPEGNTQPSNGPGLVPEKHSSSYSPRLVIGITDYYRCGLYTRY
jgi:hypothetical protein